MEIKRSGSQPSGKRPAGYFAGSVRVDAPFAGSGALPQSGTEADVAKGIGEFCEKNAIPAASFARMVAFAISQPDDVDVNEILFRPTAKAL